MTTPLRLVDALAAGLDEKPSHTARALASAFRLASDGVDQTDPTTTLTERIETEGDLQNLLLTVFSVLLTTHGALQAAADKSAAFQQPRLQIVLRRIAQDLDNRLLADVRLAANLTVGED